MRQPAAYDEFADWYEEYINGDAAPYYKRVDALLDDMTAAGLRLVRAIESGPAGIPDLFGLLAELPEERS
jgi:hypothetical protein